MIQSFVNIDPAAQITHETLKMLDMGEVGEYFIGEEKFSSHEIFQWISTYLTADPHEIARRNAILEGFHGDPEAYTQLRQIYADAVNVKKLFEESRRPLDRLRYCGVMSALLDGLGESIENVRRFLARFDRPEIAELARRAEEFASGEEYLHAQALPHSLREYIRLPEYFDAGVNISESGGGQELVILDVGGDTPEDPKSIIGSAEDPNCLFEGVSWKQRRDSALAETLFLHLLERRFGSALRRAQRELKSVSAEMIVSWLNFILPAEFYLSGLRLIKRYEQLGCPFCFPGCTGVGISAEGMYYPHMVLASGKLPVPCSVDLLREAGNLITGANSSGKTSLLKSVAQNCILAQMGLPVAAEKFSFSPFESFLCVFGEEPADPEDIVRAANERALVLLNEPLVSSDPGTASRRLCDLVADLVSAGSVVLLVTHIYDVYYLAVESGMPLFESYVMKSRVTPDGAIAQEYFPERCEPDGISYARAVAQEFQVGAEDRLPDSESIQKIREYIGGLHI